METSAEHSAGPIGSSDRPSSTALVRTLAQRFRTVVARLDDDAWSAPVGHLAGWTVRDLVAHVAGVAPLYVQGLGDPSAWIGDVGDTARFNSDRLERYRSSSRGSLLDLLATEPEALAGLVERDPWSPTAFHYGARLPRHLVAAALVGELLVHGWDLVRATGGPWEISPEAADAALGLNLAMFDQVMSRERAAGLTATIELRVRGAGTHHLHIEGGRASNDRNGSRPDCRLSGTGEALLMTMYKRRPGWRYALTGRLSVRGRRPWLAGQLDRLVPEI
jgi:uncharacterized protein (TIGR03083 family)